MYMTPVVWPASQIHNPVLRTLMWLNPMAFVVECGRSMFLGTSSVTWRAGLMSGGMTALLLVSGLLMFNRVQRTFVDTI